MLATVNANCPAVKDNSILNNNGGASIKFEENQGASIESGDIAKAILPYSAGVWSFQSANSSNPTVDLRNGVRLENHVTLANPSLTTNDFAGVRYVFNILDNAGNLQGYQAGFYLVGFNNVGVGAKSPLCSNNGVSDDQQFAFSAISTFGFAPLGTTGGPAGSNTGSGSGLNG